MATNMVSQDILPLPVQQVAAAQRLGAFIKVYKASIVKTLIGAIVLLGGGVLFLAGTIYDDTLTTKFIFLLFLLFIWGLAIYLIYTVVQAANQQVYLFQQGIAISKGDQQVQAFPWEQASEVWQSVTRNYRNGVYVGTTYLYTLRRTDGYQVKLGNLTKGIAELGPAIAQGITQERVPRTLYLIRNGQTLTFTPFSINQQGISNGREFISWAQVQAVDVKQGRVTIKKIGVARAWGTAMVAKIPNFLVFIVISQELMRVASSQRRA